MYGTKPLEVEITESVVRILDAHGYEVVMWVQAEWEENPDLPKTIANAVRMAKEEPDELLMKNQEHIEAQLINGAKQ